MTEPTRRRSTDQQRPGADHHRDVTGGALRAGVFGAMDGLVSNFALVSGVMGGGVEHGTAVLTGLAGLAAGAFSMAVGEYTSVASQSEATLAEVEKEKRELIRNPHGETKELAEIYESYGVDSELAHKVAHQITTNPDTNWKVHSREELGVDPEDLPRPLVAAGSSFLCFSIGALIPILPLLFGINSVLVVALVSAVALFLSGALVARITVVSPWLGGLRQLLLGLAAAAATFGFGWLVGGSVG